MSRRKNYKKNRRISSEETVLDFVEGKAIERVKEGDGSMIRLSLRQKDASAGMLDAETDTVSMPLWYWRKLVVVILF
ncbi:hypothetical protein HRI96_07275 [Treponema parvum]|uniref:Uncharacterized protein n=1 Tax=Treponema parvum TaxID=138851 RepID=A0A975F0G7_9SPIR|nr:hypothetical protein [Treponema parvum]QTQ12010.1 hypothetical protein HRI96_07275 [Treponema parvum]QTQ16013.1 hypothetical protein HXT04_04470 [Treponema parvum]